MCVCEKGRVIKERIRVSRNINVKFVVCVCVRARVCTRVRRER